jgi:phospholipid methyltransferase
LDDQSVYGNRVHVRKDKTNPRRLAILSLLLFSAQPGWPMLSAGMVLVVAAVALHGWAAGYLARAGYAEREKKLTVRGPYRHNRNPYYLAQFMMDTGFFLLAGQPLFLLLYLPISFTVYSRWVAQEEFFLEKEFGEDYRVLKREVPRWGFQIKPAPARGHDLTFQWATYKINHELPRTLSHLSLMLLFVLFAAFGNPLVQSDFWLRLTLLAAIAVWLVVRDIYPIDGSEKSVGWGLIALCLIGLKVLLITSAPLWQAWTGATAWLAITLGLSCSLAVVLSAFPGRFRAAEAGKHNIITRPMCQWYIFALGLGLASCTLGGVWLGIKAALVLWALNIGRLLPVKMIPQHVGVGVALLALVAVCSGIAIVRQFN